VKAPEWTLALRRTSSDNLDLPCGVVAPLMSLREVGVSTSCWREAKEYPTEDVNLDEIPF